MLPFLARRFSTGLLLSEQNYVFAQFASYNTITIVWNRRPTSNSWSLYRGCGTGTSRDDNHGARAVNRPGGGWIGSVRWSPVAEYKINVRLFLFFRWNYCFCLSLHGVCVVKYFLCTIIVSPDSSTKTIKLKKTSFAEIHGLYENQCHWHRRRRICSRARVKCVSHYILYSFCTMYTRPGTRLGILFVWSCNRRPWRIEQLWCGVTITKIIIMLFTSSSSSSLSFHVQHTRTHPTEYYTRRSTK